MADSWGNLYRPDHEVIKPLWRTQVPEVSVDKNNGVLAVGNRRSYGDVCINDGGSVIHSDGLNRFISFDRTAGVIRCEAGVTLWQIAQVALPHGWFLPVTPGTGYATIAGAVANDVHGKNHHISGSFGCYVQALELKQSSGETLLCSAVENSDIFAATIGGLGLTGMITWVQIELKKIDHALIDVESIQYESYQEFLALSDESENSHEYCVSWINCLSESGGGVFFRGNHAKKGGLDAPLDATQRSIPAIVGAGFPLVNQLSLRVFNNLYLRSHAGTKHYTESIGKFFYPLDSILHWNRIYGRRGFYQFQCVVPTENAPVIKDMFQRISSRKQGSFLSVLKTMGNKKSQAMLSFCRPGISLALDFPNHGRKTTELLTELEDMAIEADGALYPAKDANMKPESFQKSYARLDEFIAFIDPAYTSSFWQRVTKN